jgi:hypothetical protein
MMDAYENDMRAPASGQVYHRRAGHHQHDPLDELDFEDDAPETLIDRVLAAPGRLGVTVAAFVAFAVVGVNAAYMQPGAHPAPMLSTRADAPAQPLPNTAFLQSDRAITMAPAPIVPPSRAYDATTHSAQPGQALAELTSLQTTGPRFAVPAPIARPAFTAVAAVPTPAPVPRAAIPSALVQRAVETIAVSDPIGALLAPVVRPNPTAGTNQPLPRAAATRSAQPVVAAVQAVLADMGYQPGSIDGVIGPSTEEAIRRFQLRRALEPNGQITTDLLEEIQRVTGTRINAS